jgi:hypothetical protein
VTLNGTFATLRSRLEGRGPGSNFTSTAATRGAIASGVQSGWPRETVMTYPSPFHPDSPAIRWHPVVLRCIANSVQVAGAVVSRVSYR